MGTMGNTAVNDRVHCAIGLPKLKEHEGQSRRTTKYHGFAVFGFIDKGPISPEVAMIVVKRLPGENKTCGAYPVREIGLWSDL
jgi:hypothetical protein